MTTIDVRSRVPDDVVGVQMSRDGSGMLHVLAPCRAVFLGIDVEWLGGEITGAPIYTAFFRPHSCGIDTGDPVQVIMGPSQLGPN